MHDEIDHERTLPNDPAAADGRGGVDRRAIMLAGLGLVLGGCTSGGSQALLGSRLPDVPWDAEPGSSRSGRTASAVDKPRGSIPRDRGASSSSVQIAGLQRRATWGAGPARRSSINPMLPPKWITIHHDAMAFRGRTRSASKGRMKLIQTSHQNGQNWADIGYHFVVDRQGLVWEGRELKWQGAHVGGQNEGNIGVMLMGNFEEQRPTSAQLIGMQRAVVGIQRSFRIPATQVRTHREWPTAATDCPGRMLQSEINGIRRERRFA